MFRTVVLLDPWILGSHARVCVCVCVCGGGGGGGGGGGINIPLGSAIYQGSTQRPDTGHSRWQNEFVR